MTNRKLSLKSCAVRGPQGRSAYETAAAAGYSGTEEEYNALLSGLPSTMEDLDAYNGRVDETLTEQGAEIQQALQAIGGTNSDTELIGEYTIDSYWNSQQSAARQLEVSGYTAFDAIEVTPGMMFEAKVRGGASSKQYPLLFVDSDYGILWHSERPAQSGWNTYTGVVPEDAAYALITANTVNDSTLGLHSFVERTVVLNSLPQVIQRVDGLQTNVGVQASGAMDFAGKTVAILGDSISTNGNYSSSNPYGNVPEILVQAADVGVQLKAYATYYDIGTVIGGHEITAADVGTELTFTPTSDDVGAMVGVPLTYNSSSKVVWWEHVQEALGIVPIPVCWSGSSVTSHEANEDEYKTSYAWHEAQIRKCGIRTPGSMARTAPDLIIIYRGVNDFSHGPYAKLTEDTFAGASWSCPETDALTGGGYGFKEGLCLTISKLQEAYPSARILLCTLPVFKRISYVHFPTSNNYTTLPLYNAAIREVAEYYSLDVLELDKCGITFANMESSGYITEDGKTHPSNAGHALIGTKALRDLLSKVNSM